MRDYHRLQKPPCFISDNVEWIIKWKMRNIWVVRESTVRRRGIREKFSLLSQTLGDWFPPYFEEFKFSYRMQVLILVDLWCKSVANIKAVIIYFRSPQPLIIKIKNLSKLFVPLYDGEYLYLNFCTWDMGPVIFLYIQNYMFTSKYNTVEVYY